MVHPMHPRGWTGLLAALISLSLGAADPGPANHPHDRTVVALVGGAEMVAAAADGTLEAILRLSRPASPVTFRCLAWEGDTAFAQPRDVNYPDLPTQLRAIEADLTVIQFGRMESLDPAIHPTAFATACEHLLDRLQAVTPSCLVVGPTPFEAPPDGSQELARARTERLSRFNDTLRGLAGRRDIPFLDLLGRLDRRPANAPRLTTDGVQWTPDGLRAIAEAVAPAILPKEAQPDRFSPDTVAAVRREIREKNRLWENYRRPTNWAFLAGDRTEQAFGRAPDDRSVRALAAETESWRPLIEAAEARIDEAVARAALPEATR